jgi:hypothetical protein
VGTPLPGFYLQVVASPGWDTIDHALDNGPPEARFYPDDALAQLASATTIRPGARTLIVIVLGFGDGGTTPEAFEAYTRMIRDRYRAAFDPDAWILHVQPWYTPTATVEFQKWQWDVVRRLAAEDPGRTFGISIAESTGYALFDGTNGQPDYLDQQKIHIANQAGCDFVGEETWGLITGKRRLIKAP